MNYTIGIPTYVGGESLVKTLKSIYALERSELICEVIVIVDGKKLDQAIVAKIQHPKLKLIEKDDRMGPAARVNELLSECRGDVFVYTNDDVLIKSDMLTHLEEVYARTHADLVTGNPQPLSTPTWLQRALNIGQIINYRVAQSWNSGNNYLNCNGRLVAFSKRLAKSMSIPPTLKNYDAYYYFYAYLYNYTIAHAPGAIVYYQMPQTLSEHLKQSTKFQVSLTDNQLHLDQSLDSHYHPPQSLLIRAATKTLIERPLDTIVYVALFVLSRLAKKEQPKKTQKGYWETDITTKLN